MDTVLLFCLLSIPLSWLTQVTLLCISTKSLATTEPWGTMMGWFERKPDDLVGLRRENKRLRQLATKQEAEIKRLQESLATEQLAHGRDSLGKERELQEAHSTIHIQQVELRQQAAVIERDRQRVQAEMAGHVASQAVANQLKQMRQGNGQVLNADKNPPGS